MAHFLSNPHDQSWPLSAQPRGADPLAEPRESAPAPWVAVSEWISYVIQITGVDRAQLLSTARSRHLTLPRALITHHGRALGFTLAELAQHLERHPSSLLESVERSLTNYPQLFTAAVTRLFTEQQEAKLRRLLARHTLRRCGSH